MDLKDWLTIGIALYGAGLSTYIFINQQRESRPRVQVKLRYSVSGEPGGKSPVGLSISVSNPGHRDTTITTAGILAPSDIQLLYLPTPPIYAAGLPEWRSELPFDLAVEKGTTFFMPLSRVAALFANEGIRGQAELRGFCKDATDRLYVSKPVAVDLDRWRESDGEAVTPASN